MTLRLVLAAYGLENVRPYRVGAGRNNGHWYVGAGLVLRRYGLFRSDAVIGCEHAIVGQLRERGWPVAVPIPSDAGRMVVADDGCRYSLFPRLAGRRGIPERPRQPRELGRLLGRLHRDLAAVSAAGPPDAFPRVLEMPADPAWQHLGALGDPVLSGLIGRKLAEVRTAASAASGRPGVQMVHGDWHDGNILYQGGTVSGILGFDFAHPGLPLADVAIAALIPGARGLGADRGRLLRRALPCRARARPDRHRPAGPRPGACRFLYSPPRRRRSRRARPDPARRRPAPARRATLARASARDLEQHHRLTRPTFPPPRWTAETGTRVGDVHTGRTVGDSGALERHLPLSRS